MLCTKVTQKTVPGKFVLVYRTLVENNRSSSTDPDERIDLRGDGRIILYKREGLKNPKWQARIRVPGGTGYKIVSTKTANLRDADRFATNLYDDLDHHVRMGGSIKTKTFAKVFEEWEKSITLMGPTTKGGSWTSTIERVRSYALEYFGSMKIDQIGPTDFQNYWLWRKENYAKKKPSNATLGRERTSIMSLFKFAAEMGHIAKVPDSKAPKNNGERRPTFAEQEWKAILRAMDGWTLEGEKKATSRDRFVAKHYFLVLANTGLRTGELRRLQWGDFRSVEDDGGKYVVADVHGKTGGREVVCQKGTGKLLNNIIDLRREELKEQYPDDTGKWKPTRGDLVFCHPDGTEIKTFKRSFHSLLDFANVPILKNGNARTIYSLRHLYATQRLYEDVSPFLLAKQMGTSVEMLEKHYGQTVTASAAAQITKTRAKKPKAIDPVQQRFED